jgi:murein DD-endopeptidase MepM/ murein hydrolase activator NlpD
MRTKILGFVLGFAVGVLTLSVLLWSSGRMPQTAQNDEQKAAVIASAAIPYDAPRPPELRLDGPITSSANRPLQPSPETAMRLHQKSEKSEKLPQPPNLQLETPSTSSADRLDVGPSGIAAPIAGLKAAVIHDTYDETRGTDRVHEALDIMAPRGTPVLAAVEGNVVKVFESKQGGHTVYQFDNAGEYCYYYAHLDRYAPGLREGMLLRQGDVLGYVGSTGNASADAPHLHFAIFRLGPDKKWWEGEPINPYPLVVEAIR